MCMVAIKKNIKIMGKTSYIRIVSIHRYNGKCEIIFDISPDLSEYFLEEKFWVEQDLDFAEIPEEICIIPFICNILPIIWLTDSTLYIDTIDYKFNKSIPLLRQGYQDMYPMLSFGGKISYSQETEIESTYTDVGEVNLALFSGGVDALSTVINHIDEELILLSVWGSADHPIDKISVWENHLGLMSDQAKCLKKNLYITKSNFYIFIDNWGSLNGLVSASKESWWHGFQHGIGLISLSAPLAYVKKCKNVYIASSFTEGQTVTCASDPSIDNNLKFGNVAVIHDGYELSRQEKICNIVNNDIIFGSGIPIHVCLKQNQTENCCRCEKCYRTILNILAEGREPNQYGFNITDKDIYRIIKDLKYKVDVSYTDYYKDIQKRIKSNFTNIKNRDILHFANYPTARLKSSRYKKFRHAIEKSFLHNIIMLLKR